MLRWFPLCCALGAILASCDTQLGDGSQDAGEGSFIGCGYFSACGGDPVGKWRISGVCLQDGELGAVTGCADSAINVLSVDQGGALELTASGSAHSTESYAATVRYSVATSCLDSQTSCSDFGSNLEAQLKASGVDAEASCELGGSRCTCDVEQHTERTVDGVWMTNGAGLTIAYATLESEELEYCSQLGSLRAKGRDALTGARVLRVLSRD